MDDKAQMIWTQPLLTFEGCRGRALTSNGAVEKYDVFVASDLQLLSLNCPAKGSPVKAFILVLQHEVLGVARDLWHVKGAIV